MTNAVLLAAASTNGNGGSSSSSSLHDLQQQQVEPFTRWSELAQKLPGRVGKQVRDRWVNHLNPAINHLPFSREDVSECEHNAIFSLVLFCSALMHSCVLCVMPT